MGSPIQLQCLCHKAVEATTVATASVVKAKISCNAASIKSSLLHLGSVDSPRSVNPDRPKMTPLRSLGNNSLISTSEVKSKLSAAPLTLTSKRNVLEFSFSYHTCLGGGPYYNVVIDDFSRNELFYDSIGSTVTIDDVDLENNLESVYTYEISDILGDVVSLKYLSDTAGFGDLALCDLCSHYTETSSSDGYGYGYGYGGYESTTTCTSNVLKIQLVLNPPMNGLGNVRTALTANYKIKQTIQADSELKPTYTDKIQGDFDIAKCVQKLYPITDVSVADFRGGIERSSGNLYDYIDEGVFSLDYYKNWGGGDLISDDINSYIQPFGRHTEGTFSFKCEMTKPLVTVKDTRVRFRMAGPLATREAKVPPRYKIHNIKFEDPSGNLVTHYDDITMRGDADYDQHPITNFANYSSAPKVNKGALREWEKEYPLLHEPSGYTLRFSVTVYDLSDAFEEGFSEGFEESHTIHDKIGDGDDYLALDGAPVSTRVQDSFRPDRSIRISAIEICNSGTGSLTGNHPGPTIENRVQIYCEVPTKGKRIERRIRPTAMPLYGQESSIYPAVSSIWYGTGNQNISNETKSGAIKNIELLNNDYLTHYITLDSTSPVADSGKLTLKFGHGRVGSVNEVENGAFNFAFDQSPGCHNVSGSFNTVNKNELNTTDNFFVVDCVFLRVLAKKKVGSRNYAIDVVGYSDDKILNVTRKIGGFLQNTSGDGSIPVTSGFNSVDDLGISSETLADADQYYETSGTNNAGGDHYLLSPEVVTTTEFKWHEIPLQVYEDTVTLGKSKDYTMSSSFEHLYLDIFPLPSGASIGEVELVVRYKPQGGLNLSTQGGESLNTLAAGRSESKIYPISRQSSDDIINAGSGYAPLSKIEGIPQSYGTPTTIKSNYSRRWRGHTGLANGPFDPEMFGFGYENPLLDSPFVSGYFDFTDGQGTDITPRHGTLTGVLSSTYSDYRFKNLGWRFTDNTLFTDQLPGYTGDYQTIDWTSLVNGGDNFESHPLYGQIADAFDTTIRTSGHNSYINFGDVDIQDQFSLYTRFSPDANVSGVGYDLFESGVLVSKWDSGNDLEFALGYSGGYLRGIAKDTGGGTHEVIDTAHYTSYQYPLSVILTYNDHYSSGLKLYTDNEFENDWTTLRASSVADFDLATGNSNLVVGNSTGSGVGFNMFLCEFGLSNSGNMVYENADLTFKEVTAQRFLENARVKWWDDSDAYTDDSYKLWDYVNEDSVTDWHLGDFKYAEFNQAFDRWTKRTGRDLISFNIDHHGSGYSQTTDITLPTNVDNDLAYHTQIENDFLRFNLSEAVDTFYSTNRRITKNLPRGYKFSEEALVVDTIIQHKGSESIVWEDGEVGPKLIVSLYTKNQEPYWVSDEPNWGLVNRDYHYLTPSSYMTKLKSVFDYDSLIDESEEWAKFPTEPRQKEFKEKYFSQDINDMFVQYDVAYPSGSPFESRIDIHTTHIRLEDAYVTGVNISGAMNLASSGGYPIAEYLNLTSTSQHLQSSGQLNLYTVGPRQIENSGLFLNTSGIIVTIEDLSSTLGFSISGQIATASNLGSGLCLIASGSPEATIVGSNGWLNLHTLGKATVTSSGNGHLGMSMTALNVDSSYIPSGDPLSLFTHGDSGVSAAFAAMPIFTTVDISHGSNQDREKGKPSGLLNLHTIASQALFSRYPDGSMNLFTFNNRPSRSLNLTLYGDNYEPQTLNEQINLYTANYNIVGTGSNYVRWFNSHHGTGIDLEDNYLASVPVDDNIRGVDIVGYGSCSGDSPEKAIDPAIITHDTTWREETCNDGGIFRAIGTYTSGSWSGNYYDIRKYTGLAPGAAYNAELKISTGSTESIKLPREWEETEYGTNSDINFSGAKLVGDNPYIAISGRNPDDNYGKSVVVKGDLMAVSAPNQTVANEEGSGLAKAGAVYLYRRNEDVAGQKATWAAEQKLVLPSGFRGNYFENLPGEIVKFPGIGSISGRQWYPGQEGREFGYSLGATSSGNKEVVVVGAPGASFSSEFDSVTTSGVPIAMMVFVDKINSEDGAASVERAANSKYTLYKYFSAPLNVGGNEVQPELDIKLLIFEIITEADEETPSVDFKEDWITHSYVPQIKTFDDKNFMTSGIKEAFHKAFPIDTSILHNNIPPIVGILQDDSSSANSNNVNGRYTDGTEASVNEFIDYYKEYSYASGVIDLSGPTAGSGYVKRSTGSSEDWGGISAQLLNDTLATGNLIANGALNFITSGIGLEWAKTSLTEFNKKPIYTGRAYVFEKENDRFNLIQEIEAGYQPGYNIERGYTLGAEDTIDRFAHSVAISDNSEVIAIGSPFARSENCTIYERSATEESRLFNGLGGWLTRYDFAEELVDLQEQTSVHGAASGQRLVYNSLSEHNKWKFRSDNLFWGTPPSIYKKVYDYHKFSPIGTWSFISNHFAPIPRLGWSTDVSENGDIAAFGAPTDSFNEFDDHNIWYNPWASYVNAGAVRVFESQKKYPHNLAVEFYRFGNLDKNSHPGAKGYDDLGYIFENIEGKPFRRTAFEENDIPQEAGLAFIITPEIDAASDEVIDNIKDWLALGDRTLVLVGNDPTFEEHGKYRQSNEIINKILEKLDSRMRIHAARNEYESINFNPDTVDDRYNVTAARVPAYAHNTKIKNPNMYASGVGDIRIHLDGVDVSKPKLRIEAPCNKLNDRCNMPLEHGGDLRAEWNEKCGRIPYKINWPFHFGNDNPSKGCGGPPLGAINRPTLEPRPLLTAAEWTEDEFFPAVPTSGYEETCQDIFETTVINDRSYYFAKYQVDNVEFAISGINGTETADLNVVSNTLTSSQQNLSDHLSFYNPGKYGPRDGFLQGAADSELTYQTKRKKVSDESVLVSEEDWPSDDPDNPDKEDSKVYLIATTHSENKDVLGGEDVGAEFYDEKRPVNLNEDQNIKFYRNLIKLPNATCDNPGIGDVGQLGGWTGRTSFKDAYEYSRIADRISTITDYNPGGTPEIEENFTKDMEHLKVAWVANPVGLPSASEVEQIKSWLNAGERKLIITYTNKESSARNIVELCGLLGLNTKPFVKSNDKLALQGGPSKNSAIGLVKEGNQDGFNGRGLCFDLDEYHQNSRQKVNRDNPVIYGCGSDSFICEIETIEGTKELTINYDSLDKLVIGPAKDEGTNTLEVDLDTNPGSLDEVADAYEFYAIKVGDRSRKIIHYNEPIYESYEVPYIDWTIRGAGETKFTVQPGSGYRLYLDYVSENANENIPINVRLHGTDDKILHDGKPYYVKKHRNHSNVAVKYAGSTRTGIIDFKAHSDEITLSYLSSSFRRSGPQPFTPRILNISGCLLPIEHEIVSRSETEIIGEKCSGVWVVDPGKDVTVPGHMRPIKTDNTKYCPGFPVVEKECEDKGGQLIEDGPVVAAEEFEHFSPGSNGSERSRIVVLADSSMIQGPNTYRDDSVGSNQAFIRSLYPVSPRGLSGRNFDFTQKLRAPERGSPSKLWAASGLDGIMDLFESSTSRPAITSFSDDEDVLNPGDVGRPKEPSPPQMCGHIKTFAESVMPGYGFNGGTKDCPADPPPRFPTTRPIAFMTLESGVCFTSLPSNFMRKYGEDHLDFNVSYSGYPGDLFGYSVSLHKDKLVVGSPFNAFVGEKPISWSGIVAAYNAGDLGSGLELSNNGGAGAAFYFERTEKGRNAVSERLPWEYKQKIKPSSINVGIDNATSDSFTEKFGNQAVVSSKDFDKAPITDQLGYSVSIDADFVAIGAPGHDMGTLHHHIYEGDSAFIRKEFNASFTIPNHSFYDLGSSGVRIDKFNNASGINDLSRFVLNNGAVFMYEHSITDWPSRKKEWRYKDKIVSQGYNSREISTIVLPGSSGNENDLFGRSVSLDRARRGDSDYTLVAGAPKHDYGMFGEPSGDAGAVYTNDLMLREQIPAIPNTGSWIDAKVFTGDGDENDLHARVYQNTSGPSIEYSVSGLINANSNGDIFLEASGYDPAVRGFVAHRPYVTSVIAELLPGIETTGYMSLLISGKPISVDSSQSGEFPSGMNLFIDGPDGGIVYNSMNLHTGKDWTLTQVGSGNTPLSLAVSGAEPTAVSGTLNLFTSGVVQVDTDDPLNLRVRGF